MSCNVLNTVSEALEKAGVNYQFGEWAGEITYPYWVGEYQESEPVNETGLCDTTFTLTGFTRKSRLELENDKEKIRKAFPQCGGYVTIAGDGSAVAVFYAGALANLPTGDAELKKIEINLSIKEWKVT